ncbi:hypothetical protein MuYL_0380 [Mucilaginibacter xinganensis]|uniref:DUF2809 domain-containing protein n=2 Tax=Mucilaginibacter xinganensis TaxID=1234841 RepID=A0A223NQZ1_9SPHI|nr:hypothetical protein MuYL_0380 [Mucilaginibacter xinganensis]
MGAFFVVIYFAKISMMKGKLLYIILISIAIISGLLSREFKVVPVFIGDILWATMVYFILRMLFTHKTLNFAIVVSLLFCFAIEFSQLYKAPWIDNLRHTLFGRLVLGETFLWSDLLCYASGIALGILVDLLFVKPFAKRHDAGSY